MAVNDNIASISPAQLDKASFISAFNKSKQRYEPTLFHHGIKVGLESESGNYRGGIEFPPLTAAPEPSGNKIYNLSGKLYFSGSEIGTGGGGGGSGGSLWAAGSAGKIHTTGSITVSGSADSKTAITVVNDYQTVSFLTQLTAGDAGGDTLKLGNTTTAAGKLYYCNTSKVWVTAGAGSADGGEKELLGVAIGTNSGTNGMLSKGFSRVQSAYISDTPSIGLPVYLSTTAGMYQFTAPSGSGQKIRVIGYCVDYDSVSGDILLHFAPGTTWVTIT